MRRGDRPAFRPEYAPQPEVPLRVGLAKLRVERDDVVAGLVETAASSLAINLDKALKQALYIVTGVSNPSNEQISANATMYALPGGVSELRWAGERVARIHSMTSETTGEWTRGRVVKFSIKVEVDQ